MGAGPPAGAGGGPIRFFFVGPTKKPTEGVFSAGGGGGGKPKTQGPAPPAHPRRRRLTGKAFVQGFFDLLGAGGPPAGVSATWDPRSGEAGGGRAAGVLPHLALHLRDPRDCSRGFGREGRAREWPHPGARKGPGTGLEGRGAGSGDRAGLGTKLPGLHVEAGVKSPVTHGFASGVGAQGSHEKNRGGRAPTGAGFARFSITSGGNSWEVRVLGGRAAGSGRAEGGGHRKRSGFFPTPGKRGGKPGVSRGPVGGGEGGGVEKNFPRWAAPGDSEKSRFPRAPFSNTLGPQ